MSQTGVRYNVQIQTTSTCNARCIMCPYVGSWHDKNPGRMEQAVFDRIIDELKEYKLDKVCPYLQNDPFTDPDIFERMERIRNDLDFTCLEVSTNAMAMTPARADRLVEILKDVPHDIWLSFHGIDRTSHETISGLKYDRCLSHILHLLKRAQETDLTIAIVGAGEPKDSRLAHEYNFSREQYEAFWADIFDREHIVKQPRIVHFRYHDRAGTISHTDIRLDAVVRPDLTGFTCPRAENWLHFLYTGELALCCMDYHREQVFADITRQSLDSILEGPELAYLKSMICGEVDSPDDFICKRCISPGG